jgi:hypothetical protein
LQAGEEIRIKVTSTQGSIGGYRAAAVTVAVAGPDGACAPVSSYCEWHSPGLSRLLAVEQRYKKDVACSCFQQWNTLSAVSTYSS